MRRGLVPTAAVAMARVLLWLYPPSFRHDVGVALVGDVRMRAGELAGARAAWWLARLLMSLVFNAGAAWGAAFIRTSREARGSSLVCLLDLKLGVRMLKKYPGLTLTGGLGIAVAVAIGVAFFGILQSRFYPTIPLDAGDRMVGLSNWNRRTGTEEHRSLYDFFLWRAGLNSVQEMTAFRTASRNIIGDEGSVDLVRVAEITPSGFRLARVPPFLGRTLIEEDALPGATPVVVIGFDVWRSRFASDPAVVGRAIRLGPTAHTIVGVMPDGFAFPVNHRFWTVLQAGPLEYGPAQGPSIYIAGRLGPGFSAADARAELTVIGERMAVGFPETHRDLRPDVMPYGYLTTGMSRRSADGFWPMTMLASLLLIVVCVNVAILIYARTATRMGEIAVRSALGASRTRIVVQLAAESLVLSGGAAAAGLGGVKVLFDQITRLQLGFDGIGSSPFWLEYRLSGPVLAYFGALTTLGVVITGVIPAVRATGRRVQSNLQQYRGGTGLRLGRTWTALIVVQVAIASAALPIATALGWLQIRDVFRVPAFPVDQLLFATMALPEAPSGSFGRLRAELSREVAAQPGVVGHSFTRDIPGTGVSGRVAIDTDASARPAGAVRDVQRSTVDLDFFRTFDLNVLTGRALQAADRDPGAKGVAVAVVNRAFAERVLSGRDVLGRRFHYVSDSGATLGQDKSEDWYEIVGVVDNIDANPFARDRVVPRVYHPMKNVEGSEAALAVRISGAEHQRLARRIREIAARLDPALSIDVIPLEHWYRVERMALTSAALGIGVSLLSVLLLSAAGVYALMSFTVTQRQREIAIRTALGAPPGSLLTGILGRALRQIALGVAIGVGVALLLDVSEEGQALRGSGAPLLGGTVLVMTMVGLTAAFGPARRGLRIQPSDALKAE